MSIILIIQYRSDYIPSNLLFVHSIPNPSDAKSGEVKQGNLCLDTLGHQAGGTVGLFQCHHSGGNQVSIHSYIRHSQDL